jgi:hypothetical protein
MDFEENTKLSKDSETEREHVWIGEMDFKVIANVSRDSGTEGQQVWIRRKKFSGTTKVQSYSGRAYPISIPTNTIHLLLLSRPAVPLSRCPLTLFFILLF